MTATLSKTGFPDLPIDPLRGEANDNRDLLGLEQHAAALAGFIEMCSMPMTIGIQGDWGSGKTSLMNLVRAKLGDGRALNVWFNTWQYAQFGNEEQLASSMLVNLMQKIRARLRRGSGITPAASSARSFRPRPCARADSRSRASRCSMLSKAAGNSTTPGCSSR